MKISTKLGGGGAGGKTHTWTFHSYGTPLACPLIDAQVCTLFRLYTVAMLLLQADSRAWVESAAFSLNGGRLAKMNFNMNEIEQRR